MVFSSPTFLFAFLPVALALYLVAGRRLRSLVLTLVSYLFYGWANPAFVLLMLFSTAVDYALGRAMVWGLPRHADGGLPALDPEGPRTAGQRRALWASVATNLGLLAFFKYFDFGVENYRALADMTGLPGLDPSLVLHVTLPLGISFYTFQSMSYSIDVYRGHARPIERFVDFAAYVSMFPQLVAGPIIRFSEVARQLGDRTHTLAKTARGIAFFSLGMAKKVAIANPCAEIADAVFDAPTTSMLDAWWGTLAYAFQIYFDFSGYSDMAIGLGLVLGFAFPRNFDAPYHSASITEFWRRWHISLSSWLRDYLYIPLGGNRKGERRTYVNLAAVMLFGGLWHGASWNFVIWGAIHGGMLGVERARGKASAYARLPHAIQVATTFALVCFAWVFFRAPTLTAAVEHLQTMAGMGPGLSRNALVTAQIWQPWHVGAMAVAAAITWGSPWQTWDFAARLPAPRLVAVSAALVLSVLLLFTQSYNPFIYFLF
ncbi:MAG: MBOAT family protein [Alphaproteobacteria bacterium]|nr:MBOAT family protein [Alphaproteobacteria bacterium]